MPNPNAAVLDFLATRASLPAKTLTAPAPDREALAPLLAAAVRVPDHGMLVPWRLIVLEPPALARLADLARKLGPSRGIPPEKAEKSSMTLQASPLIVAVVFSPKASEKTPAIEQLLSAGAVCLTLLNAALAAGWGACWITGWMAHDAEFCRDGLGLGPEERIAGFVHIGTSSVAPFERPRPDMTAITTWLDR